MEGCPYRCIYCDQYKITKKTTVDWKKTFIEVQNFLNKHKNKPKEVAFFGGTFTCLSVPVMQSYFDNFLPLFDANTYFRISTRPDAINEQILKFLKKNRVNTIELGVQSFCDSELATSNRGYTAQTAVQSCKKIIESDFSISVQLIIGLPGANYTTYNQTIEVLKQIKPHYVRLYPLLVLKDTVLAEMYKNGDYLPLTLDEAIKICRLFFKNCEENGIKVIKIGLHSDINSEDILAGPFDERLGEKVREL